MKICLVDTVAAKQFFIVGRRGLYDILELIGVHGIIEIVGIVRVTLREREAG